MPGERLELKKQPSSVREARGARAGLDGGMSGRTKGSVQSVLGDAERKGLHQTIEEQGEHIAALRSQMQGVLNCVADLKTMLLTATAQREELGKELDDIICHRNEDVYAALYALHSKVAAIERNSSNRIADQGAEGQDRAASYQQLVQRIREIARSLPLNATLIVASKGDNDLLRLYGRRAWHFPQKANGVYAGFHPAGSTAAIVHLEALRAKGANYFLLPNTMFWWLDHYVEFKRYLETNYRLIRQEDACLIFALRSDASPGANWRAQLAEAIASCQSQSGQESSVLDWNTGLNLAAEFPELAIFSPRKTDNVLPYFDESVDVVAVASWDFISRTEAQRVAKAAVVKFSRSQDSPEQEPSMEVVWKRDITFMPTALTSSIVIPYCNNLVETETCLAAVSDTLPRDFKGEIIVVDVAATADVPEGLQRLAKLDNRVKISRSRKSMGFLAACNCGAQAATGDILIFVSPMVVPLAGWLPPVLRIFREYPNVGAVGGKHFYSDGWLREAGGVVFSNGSIASFGNSDPQADKPFYNFVRKVDYCSVTFLATQRPLFEEVNGLAADFSHLDYGAADYGLKVRGKGCHVYYQPETAVFHAKEHFAVSNSSTHNEVHEAASREMFQKQWADKLKGRPSLPPQFDSATLQFLATQY